MNGPRKSFTRLCLVLFMTALAAAGCRGYGEVSPRTYDYAMALYAITNRRAENKLDEVSQKIDASRLSGELSDQEAAWLEDIVGDARAGDWQRANQASRTMMEDQVH